MRKNGDWYDEEDILMLLTSLLVRYSPLIRKDVIIAFQEFIDKFEKLEITWLEWEAVYRAGASPEEVAKDIIYPAHASTALVVSEPRKQRRWKSYVDKKGGNDTSLSRERTMINRNA
jgi:hypothetical protein